MSVLGYGSLGVAYALCITGKLQNGYGKGNLDEEKVDMSGVSLTKMGKIQQQTGQTLGKVKSYVDEAGKWNYITLKWEYVNRSHMTVVDYIT